MKSLIARLSGIAPFLLFPILIILRKRRRTGYVFVFFTVLTLSSCYLNFYRTNTKPSIDANTASKLQSKKKYFIIHFENSTNGLEQVHVKGDSIYGRLVQLPAEHAKYLHPDFRDNENVVKSAHMKDALIEVHLYINELSTESGHDSIFSASLSSFNRADVYEFNEPGTSVNHIMSTVGIVLGTFFVFAVTVAIILSAQ